MKTIISRISRYHRSILWMGAVAAMAPVGLFAAGDLAAPFRVEANGKPIDTDIGHAAPFVADFDGDGVPDLLVGQFGEGKLRLYRNQGTKIQPKFGNSAWFKAGGADARVPAG